MQERARPGIVLVARRKEEALHDAGDEVLREALLGRFECVTLLRDCLAVGTGHRRLLEISQGEWLNKLNLVYNNIL